MKKLASFKEPVASPFPSRGETAAPERAISVRSESPTSRFAPPSAFIAQPAGFLEGAAVGVYASVAPAARTNRGGGSPSGSSGGSGGGGFLQGLEEVASLVGNLIVPTSQAHHLVDRGPPSRAGNGSFSSSHSNRELVLDLKLPAVGARSPSRLSSPVSSPRSPSSRKGLPSSVATAASGPAGLSSSSLGHGGHVQGSRRAQLHALLSKDIAAPQDVTKFKAELSSQARPPAAVTALAGGLQEKFERVQRQLRNWDLVETSATERFNSAMDAALEALFSRIDLAWPGRDLFGHGGGGSAAAKAASRHFQWARPKRPPALS
ncbi:hypothetical protein GPECTOR_217g450 [Gonium pectorale]|uniref:Uncharacterized protein n=1 Tax=Gonium pectorale TaxID=33097 RepID=A0A150FWQ5_GONPE|nr:hypothetical protein GPECTOR_217g450 [Gonium pectorale]|eukprot:KXZ42043.1 hypothetical protein GPECTOR_217g450 [Gonium pectorale]